MNPPRKSDTQRYRQAWLWRREFLNHLAAARAELLEGLDGAATSLEKVKAENALKWLDLALEECTSELEVARQRWERAFNGLVEKGDGA